MRPSLALAAALALALAACGGDDDGAPPDAAPSGALGVQVTAYDYTLDLESRAARAVVHARVTAAGDCLTLPVRADVAAGSVTLDGAPATGVTVAGDALTACGAGWAVDDALVLAADVTVPLETWGASQVGYSIATDANGAALYYLVSWVGGCDRFGPCDPAPGEFARYTFTITHPEGVEVLCPGDVTAGATETRCVFDHAGGPTYSTFGVIASSGWTTSSLGTWDGLAVTAHDRVGSGVIDDIDVPMQTSFLAWMRQTFGPYPYGDTLRIVTAPTYWSGFEHPGNIVLADNLDAPFGNTGPVNHTLLHELAHQWAGDETTLAGTYDFVWKEAMAEYLSFVHEETARPELALGTVRGWKGCAPSSSYYPVPAAEPPLLDYYGHVYCPGPMILFRQLEALTSRAQVLEALAALLGEPRAIGVADVRAALEDATGLDLAGYFDAWVYGDGAPEWPRFTVTTTDLGADVEVTVTQASPATPMGCAFAVELVGAGEGESVEVWIDLGIDGSATVTEVAPDVPFDVVDAVLDPHTHCLAYEATPTAAPAVRMPPGWTPWTPSTRRTSGTPGTP